jgi:1,4-dihydroxy-2-naphthoate octaprenyltransferase
MEAEKFKTYRILETGGKIFGLPLGDIYILVAIAFLFVSIPAFVNVKLWFYLIALLLLITLFKVLKYYSKKDEKSFLMSLISFKMMQPNQISVIQRKIKKEEDAESI